MKAVRRHREDGGYPRGEETRARIIDVAMALFGEKGFEGVSTREIAAEAAVPPPSLRYYFENKEGLYLSCIEYIQAAALKALGPALDVANARLAAGAASGQLVDAYCGLLDSLTDFLIGAPDAKSRALFIARRNMPSEAAARRLEGRNLTGRRVQTCCNDLVAAIAGKRTSPEMVRLIVTTINGQMLGIYLARDHLKTLTGWDEITPDRLTTLKTMIRRQTAVLLTEYATHPPQ